MILKDTQCLMLTYAVINVCNCIRGLETPQCFGKTCSIKICPFLSICETRPNLVAGGWLFKISRRFHHVKISNAAINAIGHLNVQVRRNTYQILAEVCPYVEYNHW